MKILSKIFTAGAIMSLLVLFITISVLASTYQGWDSYIDCDLSNSFSLEVNEYQAIITKTSGMGTYIYTSASEIKVNWNNAQTRISSINSATAMSQAYWHDTYWSNNTSVGTSDLVTYDAIIIECNHDIYYQGDLTSLAMEKSTLTQADIIEHIISVPSYTGYVKAINTGAVIGYVVIRSDYPKILVYQLDSIDDYDLESELIINHYGIQKTIHDNTDVCWYDPVDFMTSAVWNGFLAEKQDFSYSIEVYDTDMVLIYDSTVNEELDPEDTQYNIYINVQNKMQTTLMNRTMTLSYPSIIYNRLVATDITTINKNLYILLRPLETPAAEWVNVDVLTDYKYTGTILREMINYYSMLKQAYANDDATNIERYEDFLENNYGYLFEFQEAGQIAFATQTGLGQWSIKHQENFTFHIDYTGAATEDYDPIVDNPFSGGDSGGGSSGGGGAFGPDSPAADMFGTLPSRSDYVSGIFGDIGYGLAYIAFFVMAPFKLLVHLIVEMVALIGALYLSIVGLLVLMGQFLVYFPDWFVVPVTLMIIGSTVALLFGVIRGLKS